MTPPPPPSRFAWRTLFARSRSAVFVFGGNRRLRYANPAWEELTGESFAKLRGTKVTATRRSLFPFAPPPEVWTGRTASVRRPVNGVAHGPPWWDMTFVPLLGDGDSAVLGVVGFLTVVGAAANLPRVKVPAEVGAERAAHARLFPFALFDGPSAATQRLASQARAAAICEVPVWIVGEPGSGKETLARVIHHNSPRRERAFVGLNCGGLQPYLIEGMLFGKGGLAGGPHVGTLYLKRPAELPRPLQDRILGWCESVYGPRLMCAATATSAELVAAGSLAPPFHTRYSALEIRVPSLRERLDDLPVLLDRLGTSAPAEVINALRAYHWPGNVRELVDLVATTEGRPLTCDLLPRVIREHFLIASAPPIVTKPAPKLDEVLEAVERRMIEAALTKTGGHLTKAAEQLGVFRTRLGRRLEALGIPAKPNGEKTDGTTPPTT